MIREDKRRKDEEEAGLWENEVTSKNLPMETNNNDKGKKRVRCQMFKRVEQQNQERKNVCFYCCLF